MKKGKRSPPGAPLIITTRRGVYNYYRYPQFNATAVRDIEQKKLLALFPFVTETNVQGRNKLSLWIAKLENLKLAIDQARAGGIKVNMAHFNLDGIVFDEAEFLKKFDVS